MSSGSGTLLQFFLHASRLVEWAEKRAKGDGGCRIREGSCCDASKAGVISVGGFTVCRFVSLPLLFLRSSGLHFAILPSPERRGARLEIAASEYGPASVMVPVSARFRQRPTEAVFMTARHLFSGSSSTAPMPRS